jgi:hypothetical protein
MDAGSIYVPALRRPVALFTFGAPVGLLLSRRPHGSATAIEGALQ